MRNWKTTGAAVVAVLAGASAAIQLVMGEMEPGVAWSLMVAAWSAAAGLFSARDASEGQDPHA